MRTSPVGGEEENLLLFLTFLSNALLPLSPSDHPLPEQHASLEGH